MTAADNTDNTDSHRAESSAKQKERIRCVFECQFS
jgi:hypothetical protein